MSSDELENLKHQIDNIGPMELSQARMLAFMQETAPKWNELLKWLVSFGIKIETEIWKIKM